MKMILRLLNKVSQSRSVADLTKRYIISPIRIKLFRYIFNFLLLLLMISIINMIESEGVKVALYLFAIYIIFVINQTEKRFFKRKLQKYYTRNKLLYVLQTNRVYEEVRIDNAREITSSGILSFEENNQMLKVYGHATGNQYSETIRKRMRN